MTLFQTLSEDRIIHTGKHFFLIKDLYPVSPGHILIISKKPHIDYFQLNSEEIDELPEMILAAKQILDKEHAPDGYNIGMNCGEVAGQTVFHFHCHIIPRYKGDSSDPRGGVRHCIPGKGYY